MTNAQAHSEIPKAVPNSMSRIDRVVAVMSGKGGVGKSSVTAMLAAELARRGSKVGILDGDITGPSIPRLFGMKKGPIEDFGFGLMPVKTPAGISIMSINVLLENDNDPLVWRGPLVGGMIGRFFSETVWDHLNVLLVDLPPGTSDAPLSPLQSLPVDGVIIVSTPQDMARLIVEKAIKMVRLMDRPILGLVENMSGLVCPHCGENIPVLGQSGGEALAARYGISWIGAFPLDPSLADAPGSIENYRTPAQDVLKRLAEATLGGR